MTKRQGAGCARWVLCAALAGLPVAQAAEKVTLRFANADLEAVVRAVGHYTGRTFVVDPRVKGTLTLSSERPMTNDQAVAALSAALRLQGFAIVDTGGVWRVVPEADAKFQGGNVGNTTVPAGARGDQLLTQVFRLQYESAANVLSVVRPLVPAGNPVTTYAGTNAIVVTDYAENLRRIERVIAALDVPPAPNVEIVKLEHAIATDVAAMVGRFTDGGAVVTDPQQKVIVLADPLTNSVVVQAGSPHGSGWRSRSS